jgi:glycosyltransferase involved in cell wall biosynthesis
VGLVLRRLNVYGWLLADRLRPALIRVAPMAEYWGYRLIRPWRKAVALRLLMRAHRHNPSAALTECVVRELPAILRNLETLIDGPVLTNPGKMAKVVARRSIVLKWPSRTRAGALPERGVLLVTFTPSFTYFFLHTDLVLLQQWFTVVLEPSWAGYCLPEILFWAKNADAPVIVEATEQTDFDFITALRSSLIPVEFGASNWVDHLAFRKIDGTEKRYDAIYIANYKPVKRHHLLFRAVSQIADPKFRLALVCTPWGGTKQTVLDLIDYYGIRKNVDVYEGESPQRVNELLNESKVSVLLSLKEGSNRSIFEGFFADIPGIVLRNNVGINKRYINESTGRLIAERDLVPTLQFFREHWRQFRPRQWAMQNIAAPVTTRALQQVLSRLATDRSEPWTIDLRVKVNRPEVEYLTSSNDSPMTTLQLMELFRRDSGLSASQVEQHLVPGGRKSE